MSSPRNSRHHRPQQHRSRSQPRAVSARSLPSTIEDNSLFSTQNSQGLLDARNRTGTKMPSTILRTDMAAVASRLEKANWTSSSTAAFTSRMPPYIGGSLEQKQHARVRYKVDVLPNLPPTEVFSESPVIKRGPATSLVKVDPKTAFTERISRDIAIQVEEPPKTHDSPKKPDPPDFRNASFNDDLGVWSGGNVLQARMEVKDILSVTTKIQDDKTKSLLHHTRIDSDCAENIFLNFIPQCLLNEKPIQIVLTLTVSDEPANWMKKTLEKLSKSLSSLVGENFLSLSLDNFILLIKFENLPPPEAVWLLDALGMLRPKCFDIKPNALAHIFERTDYTGSTDILQTFVFVRSSPHCQVDPLDMLTKRLCPNFVISVPNGTLVHKDVLIRLISALQFNSSLDAAVSPTCPISVSGSLMTTPMTGSHIFGYGVADELVDSGCRKHIRPHYSKLAIVRVVRQSPCFWRTSCVNEVATALQNPRSAEEVLSSERNAKARQWASIYSRWRHFAPDELVILVMLTIESLLWMFNLTVFAACIRVATISRSQLDIFLFQVIFLSLCGMQVPLVISPSRFSFGKSCLLATMLITPTVVSVLIIHYILGRGDLIAPISTLLESGDIFTFTQESGDLIWIACLTVSIIICVIAAIMGGRIYCIMTLPHELLSFPGRYLIAVPYSIGTMAEHSRMVYAATWLTANSIGALCVFYIDIQTLHLCFSASGALLLLSATYKALKSILLSLYMLLYNAIRRCTHSSKGKNTSSDLQGVNVDKNDRKLALSDCDTGPEKSNKSRTKEKTNI
uniref:Uncharacterized protein n=1 Tax=Spongospora subterranea TaxID=70186 RepID=A0A0H5QZ43_9EUKA|eukprot:CRZ00814.1 hypothetical protein [Spongospora subterranea]